MKILLAGASGFIGSALVDHLRERGHVLRLGVRRPSAVEARWPGMEVVALDFDDASLGAQWSDAVDGVDAVVNTVGIIRETRHQRFRTLHVDAPIALFEAAVRAGVGRVIQVSALGADADASSAYHLSKREADRALLALHPHAAIVQPSLVFGAGGASARLFLRMAASPLIPLLGKGQHRVQPVHLADLCECISQLLTVSKMPRHVAAVGPDCLTLRAYLEALRSALGLGRAHWLMVPRPLVRIAAKIGDRLQESSLDSDRLAMLERGNCADAETITALLGRPPRRPAQFIAPVDAPAMLGQARLGIGLGALKASIAIVWIASGVVSFGIWPVEHSLSLLARCGLTGVPALVALYGSASLDVMLGIGTLALRGRLLERLYQAQIGLILAYTLVIGIFLPELLLHPFAPIVKNLPMLAVLLVLLWSRHE